ncbi:MAG: hypothetical protein K8S27_11950 [Candidatus Omnitrophica bacterium]|nr:hypothetical protein [Candidatus Omnitrophota bacterium]
MSSFLLNKVSLQNDAVSYYDHIKYYVDHLMTGAYPSWDPHWNFGVPNEYFLRRFNGYNPVFLVIVFLRWLGLSHIKAYFFFLVVYFFLGAGGLYGIVKRLTRCSYSSFLAFCLFIFSSMSIKLFESYLILVSVPLLWFFFFLIGLSKEWSKKELLGLVFTMMLINSTYIPFFSFNIIATFSLCCILFYPKRFFRWLAQFGSFTCRHKWFVLLLTLILASSFLPGWFFYQETKQSEFTLPGRIMADEQRNIFEIQREGVSRWGMVEHIVFSSFFKDYRLLRLNAFFVPLLGFIIMGLGFIVKTTKRLCFFVAWTIVLFLSVSPQTSLYEFLYKHIFYYKLYRNLHFYLWFFVLPLGIVLASEIWCQFLTQKNKGRAIQLLASCWIIFMVQFILRVLTQSSQLTLPSVITLLMSGLVFLMIIWRNVPSPGRSEGVWAFLVYGFILFASFYPSMETYTFLIQRTVKHPLRYRYDAYQTSFEYERDRNRQLTYVPEVSYVPYCSMKGVDAFIKHVDQILWRDYLKTKFIIYDQVEGLPFNNSSFRLLKRSLLQNRNIAYVTNLFADQKLKLENFIENAKFLPCADTPLKIKDALPEFQVTRYRADQILFKTNFDQQKFIVYTDAFHKKWQAYLDGKQISIFQSQMAFKGLMIPPGKHVITLRFLSFREYFFPVALYGLFFVTFIGVIAMHCADVKCLRNPEKL